MYMPSLARTANSLSASDAWENPEAYLAQLLAVACCPGKHVPDRVGSPRDDIWGVVNDQLFGGGIKSGQALWVPHHAWISHAIPSLGSKQSRASRKMISGQLSALICSSHAERTHCCSTALKSLSIGSSVHSFSSHADPEPMRK